MRASACLLATVLVGAIQPCSSAQITIEAGGSIALGGGDAQNVEARLTALEEAVLTSSGAQNVSARIEALEATIRELRLHLGLAPPQAPPSPSPPMPPAAPGIPVQLTYVDTSSTMTATDGGTQLCVTQGNDWSVDARSDAYITAACVDNCGGRAGMQFRLDSNFGYSTQTALSSGTSTSFNDMTYNLNHGYKVYLCPPAGSSCTSGPTRAGGTAAGLHRIEVVRQTGGTSDTNFKVEYSFAAAAGADFSVWYTSPYVPAGLFPMRAVINYYTPSCIYDLQWTCAC